MASSITAFRGNPSAVTLDRGDARDRSVRRRINAAWGLLFFNTLTYTGGSILHFPLAVGKGLAQAALPVALFILLTVNPQLKIRPNAFLCIVGLLVMGTALTAVQTHHLDSIFLTLRLAGYVGALWLLTPWWGRSDMMLLRIHLSWIYVALGLALLGMLISPSKAYAFDGRLEGVLWPMTATQLAQYGAVAVGLTVILWLARQLSGRLTLVGVTFAMVLVLLTHTRTALVALVAGILMAGMSIFAVNARVRKFFAAFAGVLSIAVLTAAGSICELASAWRKRTRPNKPDRPHQLLGTRTGRAAHDFPAGLRFRSVRCGLQWQPNRQHLAGCLPDGGNFRRCRVRHDAGLPSSRRPLPVVWSTARARSVYRHVLHDCLIYRGRFGRCLNVPAPPCRRRFDPRISLL